MWYDEMFSEVEKLADAAQAEKMSAYMQNRFPFLGIAKPRLNEVMKPHLAKAAKEKAIDWDFLHLCWEKDYREAQYIGIEYLNRCKKKLVPEDMDELKLLITTKSWWETVDSLDVFVGIIVLRCPALKAELLVWSTADNLWLRRVAIDFQQEYKEQTDTALLEQIICNNLGTEEYFINKAIGWSLRDYSKTDPAWVAGFLERHRGELSKLSLKEAGKYL